MTSRVTLDCAPVRTEPAYRAVARLIESKILKGEWSIGNSLPSELALAKVSASIVRRSARRSACWRRTASYAAMDKARSTTARKARAAPHAGTWR